MLIYEDNGLKKIWDYYIMLCIVIIAIEKPYAIAVHQPDEVVGINRFAWGVLVEVSFCIDIVLTFFTAYYDEAKCRVIDDQREIAKNYLRSWFFIDLLTVIPFGLILGKDGGNVKLFRIYRITRLLRLLRVAKIGRISNKSHDALKIGIFRILKFCIIVLFLIHFLACFYLWQAK